MFEIIFYPHICVCTYTCIYRESVNLWHDTFNQMYFRDAYTHLYDTGSCKYSFLWHDAAYTTCCDIFERSFKPLTSLFTETWQRDVRALSFETSFENISAGGIGCTFITISFMCVTGLFYICEIESFPCVRWPRYAYRVLQCYVVLMAMHLSFFIVLNPYPCMNMHYISPIHMHV